MANTTDMIAYFLSRYEVTLTSGTEIVVDDPPSPSTEYNIIATGTQSGSTSTYLFLDSGSQTDNYTDWSSSVSIYWK